MLHPFFEHVTSSPTCRGGEASQPRQVWFSFDNTTVLSISELSPCVPRLCYIVLRSCIYQPHSLISDIYRRIYISVMMGPTLRTIPLLTQDFLFLHFCNHKQNRSGRLPEEDKALLILHIYCYRIIFYLRFSHASTYQRHHWW